MADGGAASSPVECAIAPPTGCIAAAVTAGDESDYARNEVETLQSAQLPNHTGLFREITGALRTWEAATGLVPKSCSSSSERPNRCVQHACRNNRENKANALR